MASDDRPLRVVSLFSGVGGFDIGLERAGMETVALCEWDEKCQKVLNYHWPDVPKWHDVSDVKGKDLPDCDLVAFGSPCQDLSVAGKRAGMVEGETRSGLFYEAIRIIKELQDDGRGPTWIVWENVVGALTSNNGLDFAAVLDSLAELGDVEQVEWRVLDAQWFGVPQRRRRVFVVACLDPRAAGGEQVLPVGARVRRDSTKGRKAGKGTTAGVESGVSGSGLVAGSGELVGSLTMSYGSGGPDAAHAAAGWLVPTVPPETHPDDVAGTLLAGRIARSHSEIEGHGTHVIVHPDGSQQAVPVGSVDKDVPINEITGTVTTQWGGHYDSHQEVTAGAVQPVVKQVDVSAVNENQRGEVYLTDVAPSLTGGGGKPGQGYPAVVIDDREDGEVIGTMTASWSQGPGNMQVDAGMLVPEVKPFVRHPESHDDPEGERWEDGELSPTLTAYGAGGGSWMPVAVVQGDDLDDIEAPEPTVTDSVPVEDVEPANLEGTLFDDDESMWTFDANASGAFPPTENLSTTITADSPVAIAYPIQDGRDIEKDQNGLGVGNEDDPAYTLDTTGGQAVATSFDLYNQSTGGDVAHTVRDGHMTGMPHAITPELAVRRLSPLECERLMGWPDNHTAKGVEADGKVVDIADSGRYRMCGNGVASPVSEWVGRCILAAVARFDADS